MLQRPNKIYMKKCNVVMTTWETVFEDHEYELMKAICSEV